MKDMLGPEEEHVVLTLVPHRRNQVVIPYLRCHQHLLYDSNDLSDLSLPVFMVRRSPEPSPKLAFGSLGSWTVVLHYSCLHTPLMSKRVFNSHPSTTSLFAIVHPVVHSQSLIIDTSSTCLD